MSSVAAAPSVFDCDQPRRYEWPARSTLTRLRGRRIGRRRTKLRREYIRDVRLLVDRDRARALHRRNSRDDGVLVGRILVRDGDLAAAAVRDVDQFLRRIKGKSIDAFAVRYLRYDFAGAGVHDH